jgi:uncharacterized membrane protein YciS (DUF1049 family)
VESLSLYEITDYELDLLERGSPAGLYLNFSIFLISTGISLVVALTTTTIPNDRLFTVYTVVAAVGLVSGVLLFGLWLRTRKSIRKLCIVIRNRITSTEVPTPTSNALDATSET